MEMIMEVTDERGVPLRLRLDTLPLSLGRGLSNDVILDDPYVDEHHARIALDENGTLEIRDLGSVNGLLDAADGAARHDRLAVEPGMLVRIGRTTLRFRDLHEPVPPALVDRAVTAARLAPSLVGGSPPANRALASRAMSIVRWLAFTTAGRLVIVGAAALGFGLNEYLGSYQRSNASDVFTTAIGIGILAAVWAGLWAIASRVIVHRFHFLAHLAVVSAAALASLAYTIGMEWLSFFVPETAASETLGYLFLVGFPAALLAAHLAFASALSRWHRWRAGLILGGVLIVFTVVSGLLEDDTFSDVPNFSAALKPVAPRWVPTGSVDDFGGVMLRLKEAADELAEKQDSGEGSERR